MARYTKEARKGKHLFAGIALHRNRNTEELSIQIPDLTRTSETGY